MPAAELRQFLLEIVGHFVDAVHPQIGFGITGIAAPLLLRRAFQHHHPSTRLMRGGGGGQAGDAAAHDNDIGIHMRLSRSIDPGAAVHVQDFPGRETSLFARQIRHRVGHFVAAAQPPHRQ